MDTMEEIAYELGVDVSEKDNTEAPFRWAGGFLEDPTGLATILLSSGLLLLKASRSSPALPCEPGAPIRLTPQSWFAVNPMYAPALRLIGG